MMFLDQFPLARRAQKTPPSAVREILKVTERPEVISFAGGLPAPEVFPVEELKEAFDRVFAEGGREAMQYGTTEGYLPLRAQIAARLSRFGRPVAPEDMVITHGSQQALDLVSRVVLDAGDPVLVESPSYLAAIQVFGAMEARINTVECDADGVIPEALERAFRREKPKLLYLNPDFQNPSGARLSLARRYEVLALAEKYGVPILEDDPYGELSYDGPRLPPLYALDRAGIVVYMSTFSKKIGRASCRERVS
jgi:2-aminoadipate transaminase